MSERTLIQLLEEAADTYAMPIGTGERLRAAAQRLREEMETSAAFEAHNGRGRPPGWTAPMQMLIRINGGPLSSENHAPTSASGTKETSE